MASKYARIEIERRFLLAGVPVGVEVAAVNEIDDRYLDGTRLRLRRMAETGGETQLKLTQKVPEDGGGARHGRLTTIYVSEAEHAVLAGLPAATLTKTRLSIPPYGIDVFHGALAGLCLAEVEFPTVEEAEAHAPPPFCGPEVTTDPRFTGGELVRATAEQVRAWAAEYGVEVG